MVAAILAVAPVGSWLSGVCSSPYDTRFRFRGFAAGCTARATRYHSTKPRTASHGTAQPCAKAQPHRIEKDTRRRRCSACARSDGPLRRHGHDGHEAHAAREDAEELRTCAWEAGKQILCVCQAAHVGQVARSQQ